MPTGDGARFADFVWNKVGTFGNNNEITEKSL
jgi:hypothetical protein